MKYLWFIPIINLQYVASICITQIAATDFSGHVPTAECSGGELNAAHIKHHG